MIAGFDKDLRSLTLRAIDQINQIQKVQLLLEMCLETLDEIGGIPADKLALLLDTYRSRMNEHLVEVVFCLETTKERLLGKEQEPDNN